MSKEPALVPVTFRDSEILIIAAHHMTEMAELAVKRDYGDRYQELSARLEELNTWVQNVARVRAEREEQYQEFKQQLQGDAK